MSQRSRQLQRVISQHWSGITVVQANPRQWHVPCSPFCHSLVWFPDPLAAGSFSKSDGDPFSHSLTTLSNWLYDKVPILWRHPRGTNTGALTCLSFGSLPNFTALSNFVTHSPLCLTRSTTSQLTSSEYILATSSWQQYWRLVCHSQNKLQNIKSLVACLLLFSFVPRRNTFLHSEEAGAYLSSTKALFWLQRILHRFWGIADYCAVGWSAKKLDRSVSRFYASFAANVFQHDIPNYILIGSDIINSLRVGGWHWVAFCQQILWLLRAI